MRIIIIIPCFNEEMVLSETVSRLLPICQRVNLKHNNLETHILCVDDGSNDSTWKIISELSKSQTYMHGIKLAHNVGHQNALFAGLEWAADNCDAAISIDADLQDDIEVIPEMIEKYYAGADVVFGVRKERKTDTFYKKYTALAFYRLMELLGTDIVYNHADYRLMSKRALKALMAYPERNLFLRGIVKSLGFTQDFVYYNRAERFAGVSKYPFRKMLNFALDGVTSFSIRPLQHIFLLGLFFIIISTVSIIYGLISFFLGNALPGWTSLLVSIWLIGGAILTAIGLVGEYIGKIYIEVKARPRYIIEKATFSKNEESGSLN